MGGGGHHPPVPAAPYDSILAKPSALCPPGFHYARETWYPHGGFYPDPKGWRSRTAIAVGAVLFSFYGIFEWSKTHEVRYRAPKTWIPSLMWNDNVPNPVDFRGRTLDRVTGKPADGGEEESHH